MEKLIRIAPLINKMRGYMVATPGLTVVLTITIFIVITILLVKHL